MIIDADHFKRINDGHGHDAGDEALKLIARVLQTMTGNTGIAGRLGGEEFAVYLPHVSAPEVKLLAASIGSTIRNQPLQWHGLSIPVTVSIGIARDDTRRPLAAVMKEADVALYAAKTGGRDKFILCDDVSRRELDARLAGNVLDVLPGNAA